MVISASVRLPCLAGYFTLISCGRCGAVGFARTTERRILWTSSSLTGRGSEVGDEGVLPDLRGLQQPAIELDALHRLAVDQKDAAAVGRYVLELLLHRLQTLVVLIAKGVVRGAVGDVAAAPEFGDVDVALGVGLQDEVGVELRRIHDRIDVGEELAILLAESLDAV